MLGSLLPGPGSWLPGSSAAPQSVSPWPPQPGDPGAATRNGAAQITAAAGRQGGLCAPLCSCTRSHTRRRALPPAEAPRALPARAQARTRTEAPSPAGKPTPTPSLLRGTRRPNLRSRCWQTLLPHPLIFTGTRPPSNYSPAHRNHCSSTSIIKRQPDKVAVIYSTQHWCRDIGTHRRTSVARLLPPYGMTPS